MRVLLFALIVLGSWQGICRAEEVEVQIVEDIDCRLGNDSRRIEVLTKRAGCTAQYSKFGTEQQIASARNGVDVCLGALQKTQKNLEGAGFTCQ